MPAELDYAMLAEYAQVQGGKLTIVGASYTFVAVPRVGGQHLLSIAGRIRAPEGLESVNLMFTIQGPQDTYVVQTVTTVPVQGDARPYAGKVGVLFAITTVVPLPELGLYQVLIDLDGEQVRRLAFEVEIAES